VSLGRIGIVIAVVAAIAKAVQVISARYIQAADEDGQPVYSNRTRTLVSLVRNVAVALLAAVGAIEVLAEVGVNTNALLAGAGVVGLAIGFGSQKLVQDLITGMFILLGDTVRVGDVVDLSGKAGVVEAISMRTITLRDYNGDVHTIPYSSIDVVTNMTKDFSFAVFDVAVAYKEDVDQVMETLREIDAQLRREWPYRRLILEPLEIAGVDAFRESSVLIKARSKVRPGEQWKVGREFNRRLKLRLDELGWEIPYPHRTIYMAGERGEEAPPAEIEALRRQLQPDEPAPRRAVGES
jgi:small conductance mechanosensitive channel